MNDKRFMEFFGRSDGWAGKPIAAARRVRALLQWPWQDLFEGIGMDGTFRGVSSHNGKRLLAKVSFPDWQGQTLCRVEWQQIGARGRGAIATYRAVNIAPVALSMAMLEAEVETDGMDGRVRPCLLCKWTLSKTGQPHCSECATGPGRGPIEDVVKHVLKTAPKPRPAGPQMQQMDMFRWAAPA